MTKVSIDLTPEQLDLITRLVDNKLNSMQLVGWETDIKYIEDLNNVMDTLMTYYPGFDFKD